MPKWVSDEGIWEQAKAAARKTYKEGDEAFWPVVTDVYRKLGGHIHHNVKSREQASYHQVHASWAEIIGDESTPVASRDNAMVSDVATASQWELDKPVTFQWMPGGIHTIKAHWRGEPIELTVVCDKATAERVQANYAGYCDKNPRQVPFGCVEHHEEEAALRFPPGQGRFEWAGDGVKCTGLATELGARNVNGRIHFSWSPSFVTDADYSKAAEWSDKMGLSVLSFPPGSRGHRDNPAQVLGIVGRMDSNNPSVGSLTNKPAFRAIEPVRSSEVKIDEIEDAVKATWSEAARKAALAARKTKGKGNDLSGEAEVASGEALMKTNAAHTEISHMDARTAHHEAEHKHYIAAESAGDVKKHDLQSLHEEAAKSHGEQASHHSMMAGRLAQARFNAKQKKTEASEDDFNDQVTAAWSDEARKAAVDARKAHARCKTCGEAWSASAEAYMSSANAHEGDHEHGHGEAGERHKRAAVRHEAAGNKQQAEEHVGHAERHSNVVTRMRAGTDTKKGFMTHAEVKQHAARRHAEGKTQEEVERELGLRMHPNHGLESVSGARHHMATGEFHTTQASEVADDMKAIYAKVFGEQKEVEAVADGADAEMERIYAKAATSGGGEGEAKEPTLDDIYAKAGVAG